jgi:demethylmenaquinone methyltransferase/2-methoxy-6-polyprenyl-1,4-benzoquinol methylase
MFSRIVPEYQAFSRWSSLGCDSLWRQKLAKEVSGCRQVLDVGAGTGDVTYLLAGQQKRAVGVDFSFEMLEWAQKHPSQGRPAPTASWTQATAAALPFADGSFDGIVSAFVLRNLKKAGVLNDSLRECFRVLVPGGRLVFLDLTQPSGLLLKWGHALYNRTVMPLAGTLIFGPRWPGRYLADSIEELGGEAILGPLFQKAGFTDFRMTPLWGGVVSLIAAQKP